LAEVRTKSTIFIPIGDNITMKKEDIWMIVVVGFSILWTAAFGWGVFG